MKTNFQRTADWLRACGKQPTPENLSVQIGCDMEETAEFLRTLSFDSVASHFDIANAIEILERVGAFLKRRDVVASIAQNEREAALDALCDRQVTGDGIAYLNGFDKECADEAVLNANDAKLVDGKPVILDGGKIGKPQGWKPADLSKFI